MPERLVRRPSLLVLVAIAALALSAAPAGAHPPDQHKAQLMPAAALSTFNVEAKMRAALTAECRNGQAGPYACKNVDLKSFVPLPALGGATGNDVWGWTDPQTGDEYAIMGTSTSTGFVRITDPENPVLVGILPTRGTPDQVLWRDIKVYKDHAFIVSEISRSGLQVFDLTRLRGQNAPTLLTADAVYDGFSRAHNISINEESGTAYAVGVGDAVGGTAAENEASNECRDAPRAEGGENGGLHMIDIRKPTQPRFLGCALVTEQRVPGQSTPPDPKGGSGEEAAESNNYSHDVECVIYDGPDRDYTGREICFGSNEGAVVIYDVTDKRNPRVISQTTYPSVAYTHQGSLTENKRFFLFGDELDEQAKGLNTTTYILDVQDLDSPPQPKAFAHATQSIDHNMYTAGNRVFQSNYTAGLRILDFDDARLRAGQLEEVGLFDVVPGVDVEEFAGTWSNYRFERSGMVAVSAIEETFSGLFVLEPRLPAPPPDEDGGDGSQQQQQQQPAPQEGRRQPAPPPGPAPSAQTSASQGAAPCATAAAFRSTDVRPDRGRVRMAFSRRADRPVQVDVFQSSVGRRVIGERLVARFSGREQSFTWNGQANRAGRRVTDGYYFVRFRSKAADGRTDVRRQALRRVKGRFSQRRAFYQRASCGLIKSYKLERPVFGGRTNRALGVAFQVSRQARVTVDVLRGDRLVKRYPAGTRRPNRTHRRRFDAEGRPRGDYRVRITAERDGRRTTHTLVSRRL